MIGQGFYSPKPVSPTSTFRRAAEFSLGGGGREENKNYLSRCNYAIEPVSTSEAPLAYATVSEPVAAVTGFSTRFLFCMKSLVVEPLVSTRYTSNRDTDKWYPMEATRNRYRTISINFIPTFLLISLRRLGE